MQATRAWTWCREMPFWRRGNPKGVRPSRIRPLLSFIGLVCLVTGLFVYLRRPRMQTMLRSHTNSLSSSSSCFSLYLLPSLAPCALSQIAFLPLFRTDIDNVNACVARMRAHRATPQGVEKEEEEGSDKKMHSQHLSKSPCNGCNT